MKKDNDKRETAMSAPNSGSTTDPYESCPECGDDMAMKVQPTDGLIGDGDEVVCPSCGYETALSVDEDGESWLQN